MKNYTLNTESKDIVGGVNEILSKATGTGVGKIYPNSDGTGEIFNDYTYNMATGSKSHAEGASTTASGQYAHAEGRDTLSDGWGAHAEGQYTKAHGDCAHAEGRYTVASGDHAHAEGVHNYDDRYAIHMVGIGTSNSNKKNAHVIKSEDGSHYIIGIGGYEGQATYSAKSLQTVISDLEEIHTPVINAGDSGWWGSQEEGTLNGTLTQEQYNDIKTRIENGLPIIIRVNYAAGYTSTFTAVSTSSSNTPGRYSFCYIDYNTNANQYFLKWFRMESDLTCQVCTKIL